MGFCVLLVMLILSLSLPSMSRSSDGSPWRMMEQYLLGVLKTTVRIILPLFLFLLSVGASLFLGSQEECKYGWISCFSLGQLALSPLIVWATAALYAVEICPPSETSERWIRQGLFVGLLVSGVCVAHGWFHVGQYAAIPSYVPIWYAVRLWREETAESDHAREYTLSTISSIPFWIVSLVVSKLRYESLPVTPSDCFVVTAAARGHRCVVRSYVSLSPARVSNRQLEVLQEFERHWSRSMPRVHWGFRGAYNVLGPLAARAICTKWLADLAYIALKPLEFLARTVLSMRKG